MNHPAMRQPTSPKWSIYSASLAEHAVSPLSQPSVTPRPQSVRNSRPSRITWPLLATLVAFTLLDPSRLVHAQLPAGHAVVHGSAAVGTAGNQMTVTNSPNAILNWQSFSIGANNGVRFQQQSAASKVLNRVTGSDASQILGSLTSNGGVWLINPHGVLFGQNARVDVAGLVASTLDISNADFLANRFNFASAGGPVRSEVMNQGEIRTSFGGRVWLLGEQVRNEGLIESPGGNIVLAAGKSIELIDSGMPNVIVRVTAPENETVNLGTLVAAGGSVDLHGGIVNQDGIIRADSVGTDALGRIVLKASQAVTLGESSKTLADGTRGGQVTIEASEGDTLVAGRVSARGENGTGGQIHFLGRQVGVYGQAIVDASGVTGGGEILVGGDYQGKNPAIRNARATFIGADATLAANAMTRGDGGRVIVWSDEATRAYGTLAARGGPAGGNGGFIETSGGWLDARPKSIDSNAPKGISGTWLLDPNDIFITNQLEPGNYNISDGPVFTSTGDSAYLLAATVESALNSGTDVTIRTGTGGANTEAGDITVAADIHVNPESPRSLTLSAHNNIVIGQEVGVSISSLGGLMNVTLISDSDGSGAGGITMNAGSRISTNGGNIVFQGGGADRAAIGSPGNPGIGLFGATLDTTRGESLAGTIDLKGDGSSTGGSGVLIVEGSSLVGESIIIDGFGQSTDSGNTGVYVAGESSLQGRNIQVTGRNGSILDGAGIRISSSARLDATVGRGSIRLTGTGLASGGHGVWIESNSSLEAEQIAVDGAAQSTASGWVGVLLDGANLRGSDIRLSGQTNSFDSSPLGKGYSTRVMGSSTVEAGTGGNILIQGLDGYVGVTQGSQIGANGNTPITIEARVPDIFESYIGEVTEGNYSGDITFRGEWVILDGRNSDNGPTIRTSGPVHFKPLNPGEDLVVGLERASFEPTISQILIGDATTRDLYFHNSNGLGPSAGPITVNSPVMFAANRNTLIGYAPAGPADFYLNSGIISTAPGDAITAVTGVLDNRTGASAFSAPNGRWLVYAADSPANSQLNGLPYDFVQFNAHYDTTPAQLNNGVLYAELLNLQGKIVREYDGTASAALDGSTTFTGAPTGYSVNVSESGNGFFLDKAVGSKKPIDVTNGAAPSLNLTDPLGKPVFGNTVDYLGDITPKPISVADFAAANKVYDGTRTATITGGTLSGLIAGDSVSLTGASGLFDDKNAGTEKPVTVAGGALSGSDRLNYSLANSSGTTAADITPKPISVADFAAANKVYDGTRTATIAGGTLSGLIAGDSVSLTGASGLFDDKNAGTEKPVTVAGGALSGSDRLNYSLANSSGTTTADITPKPISVADFAAANKVYDGTRTATIAGGTLSGLIAGDSVSLTGASGLFDDKNAGTEKPVTVAGGALSGSDRLNYSLANSSGTTTADITPKPISVADFAAANKVYDGTRTATITGGTLSGLIAGDSVSLTGASGLFDDKNAGTEKPVTVAGGALSGSDRLNYSLANSSGTTAADITPKPISVADFAAANKVYDGTRTATITGGTLSGLIAGDSVSLTGASGLFDDKNAGTEKPVTVAGGALSGSDRLNYSLANSSGTTTADITPATLTYIADLATRDQGLPVSGLTGTLGGFVGSDTAANATAGALAWRTLATAISPPGRYPVKGEGLSAINNNYVFMQSPNNATALTLLVANRRPIQAAISDFPLPPEELAPQDPKNSFDAMIALAPPGAGQVVDTTSITAASFGPLDLALMNRDEMQQLLDERKEFKRKLFTDAIYKLDEDPSLADVRPCPSPEDVNSGLCIPTDEQRAALAGKMGRDPTKHTLKVTIAKLPQIERKIAVLFGINKYADKTIPELENAIPDAQVVGALLAQKLGYEVRVVKNATKVDIVRTLNQLSTEVGPHDSVIIYYAGHGYQLEKSGAGYWLPADASPTDPARWISNTDVAKMLSGVSASQMALISDSCYSGAFTKEKRVEISTKELNPVQVLTTRSVVVMSSGGDEPVADEGKDGHSIFAWYLMQNISQVDNWQPGTTIFEQVRRDVRKAFPQTPQYGAAASAGHQGGDYLFEFRQIENVQ